MSAALARQGKTQLPNGSHTGAILDIIPSEETLRDMNPHGGELFLERLGESHHKYQPNDVRQPIPAPGKDCPHGGCWAKNREKMFRATAGP